MGPNESRLRAMLDPNSLADWNLNEEDRHAVGWALALIAQQNAAIEDMRKERIEELRRIIAGKEKAKQALRILQDATATI